MEDSLAALLSVLDPTPIYNSATSVALSIMSTVSGLLLIVALSARILTTSAENIKEGRGKWEQLLFDLFAWGTVLASYFGLVYLFNLFFNGLYNWTAENGSLSLVFKQHAAILANMEYSFSEQGDDASVLNFVTNFASNIPKAGAWIIYFITYVLLLAVAAFMNIAHAFSYATAIMWGTIAIPMHISSKWSLLKGWGIFCGVVVLWPLLENLMMFFVMPLMSGAADQLAPESSGTENIMKAGMYVTLSVLNLLLAAFIVAAPLVSYSLVSNSGSVTGLIAPFTAAAAGATAAIVGAAYKNLAGGTQKSATALAGGALSTTRDFAANEAIDAGLKSRISSVLYGPSSGGSPVSSVTEKMHAGGQAPNPSGTSTGPTPTNPAPASGVAEPASVSAGSATGSKAAASSAAAKIYTASSALSPDGDTVSSSASVEGSVANVPESESAPKKKPAVSPQAQAKRGAIINAQNKAKSRT